MKKKLAILLVLALVLTLAIPVLAACNEDNAATVTAIKVVDPVKEYEVNAKIDYDNLKIKVTYSDNKEETKTLKELGATHTNADLSKVGNTSYTVTYKGKSDTVSLTVKEGEPVVVKETITAFVAPEFYTNYKTASAERTQAETRADFRVTGEVYEVGNVNKFIFQPTAKYLAMSSGKPTPTDLQNVKTTVKVSVKDSIDGAYAEVTGDDLTQIVAIDNNTYKFTADAAGKYVKLDVSIDANEYNVESLENKVISVELLVVDGGYNVYDQMGLSVMNDLYKKVWAPIWGCTVDADFNLVAGDDPIKLVADEQPLYTYVGNIKSVVMHTSLTLDADKMPADFFWTTETEHYDDMYTLLNQAENTKQLAEMLDGSLRDGTNDGNDFKLMDLNSNGTSPALAFNPNMVKGFYGTCKVSVSGNYNSVVMPKEKSALGRHFYSVMDDDDGNFATPAMHWDIFQILQSKKEGSVTDFYIKNIAATGINSQSDDTSKCAPAGASFLDCYGKNVVISNVLVNSFYSTINCQHYGDTSFTINNSKLYDSFSNMFFGWRAEVKVNNSDLIGSGGPLFVMSDGDRRLDYNASNIMQADDDKTRGCVFTVDSKSVLQAYAQGGEKWYELNNAAAIFNVLKGQIETDVLNNLGKTVVFNHPDDPSKGGYLNVIAIFISEVGSIFSGSDEGGSRYMPEVHGMFTTLADDGTTPANLFKMHNPATNAVKLQQFQAGLTQFNATMFPPVIQIGNKFGMVRPDTNGTQSFMDVETGKFLTQDPSFVPSWMATTNDKMAIYLSAGALSGVTTAPYIGVILDVANYTPAA